MESPLGLTPEEMARVREVFMQAEEDAANCFLEEEEHLRVMTWRYETAVSMKPYLTLSASQLPTLTRSIFTDLVITDFLFDLHVKFTSRWAESDQAMNALHHNLARGLNVAAVRNLRTPADEKAAEQMRLTPKEFTSRLSNKEDIVAVLDHNPWITMILLGNLYPNFKSILPRTQKNRQSASAG